MALIGRELSPVVAVQQVVGRCQCNLPSQAFIQCRFNLTDHEHPTSGSLLKKGGQKLPLISQAHVLTFAPPCSRGVSSTSELPVHEASAQLTRPTRRHAYDLCCICQAQAIVQRQYDRLRLAQLLYRLRSGYGLAGIC